MKNHFKVCENNLATKVDELEQSSRPLRIVLLIPWLFLLIKKNVENLVLKWLCLMSCHLVLLRVKDFVIFVMLLVPSLSPFLVTLVWDTYRLYLDEKISLKNIFIASKMRVCLNTWSSLQNINYMIVIACFCWLWLVVAKENFKF